MDEEKKTVSVNLELEQSLAQFHKQSAEQEGITLEAHLLDFIKKKTVIEQEARRKQVRAYFENLDATGEFKGFVPDFEE